VRCAQLAELRSALVDGALGDGDRERVLGHLVGCAGCRREVAELRELRRLLGSEPGSVASPGLSSRLVAIAGASPAESRRKRSVHTIGRRRGRRVVLATATAVATVGSAVGLGYLVAPTPVVAAVADPATQARAEYAAALSQLPLADDAVAAVLATSADLTVASTTVAAPPSAANGRAMSSAEAAEVLSRAIQADDELSYRGVQTVIAVGAGSAIEATVQLEVRAGEGSEVQVFNRAGRSVRAGFTPDVASSRLVDSELLALLNQRHRLSGWTGERIAGRPASVVEASRYGSAPAARWWFDVATGLLLRLETYDATGAVTLATAFRSLDIGPRASPLPPSAQLVVPATTASLTTSHAGVLTAQGWPSPTNLAGLSLVRLRRGDAGAPKMVHLVYSDGVRTLSVFEQRGSLPKTLPGWRRDPELGAYVRPGTPSFATWQSGEMAFTVVTSGPVALLEAAVAALPPEGTQPPTTMERVRAGWARILQ
jgi:anti-sigma factor RsiW